MLVRNILLALGGLSLIGGLLLAIVWFRQIETAPQPQAPVAQSSIMVASHAVAAGTLLRPEDVAWKEVAAGDIQTGFVVRRQGSATEFVGAITRRPFAAAEPFVVTDLVRPNERQFLAAALKPGTRAVSIAVDAPQSAAGLILPGDQVDIILAQNFTEGAANRRAVAETVLRDIRVIAIDQSLSRSGRDGGVARTQAAGETRAPRTVTFEVTEKQAERLIVAAQLGRLQLSVRPLQVAPAETVTPSPAAGPTWADEVSPALNVMERSRTPPATTGGGGIERTIRRPPAAPGDWP
jgi:pilus assembly protein CpaB